MLVATSPAGSSAASKKYPLVGYCSIQLQELPILNKYTQEIPDGIVHHQQDRAAFLTPGKIYGFALEKLIVQREGQQHQRDVKASTAVANDTAKLSSTFKTKVEKASSILAANNKFIFNDNNNECSNKGGILKSPPTLSTSFFGRRNPSSEPVSNKGGAGFSKTTEEDRTLVANQTFQNCVSNTDKIEKSTTPSKSFQNPLIRSTATKKEREAKNNSSTRTSDNNIIGKTVQKYADALSASFVACTGKS